MKKGITGPLVLALCGLAMLAIFPSVFHLPHPTLLEKIGTLFLPLLCTLSGMTWLMLRLQKQG